ncbi:Mannosyl-oligosaccharide alpha-1,3-glucosidase [Penicillium ucsense]|uniref:chitinase n=1 Tax=Penicillium ucsense TaxID=2839758 RepID=A0A8J8W4X1_9EURO|nr:Mannosyl-oligosaccharide alpha-1,3-glucosidase [Penicillium ucsense]KAF7737712.1 Mannosyl-oligosaccharide alpha-1,3-glucosidase [Penicillium ucsense]
MRNFWTTAAWASLMGSVVAQTFTNCNPLEKDCPADPALGTEHEWWLNSTLDTSVWNMSTGSINYANDAAEFTIAKVNESTLMQSNFYIFFGVVETWVKMAKGGGVVSSVVLESDDLDEIDWEWVGYNTSAVQSNFFGKGNTTSYDRGGIHYVPNADTEWHNYTTLWTSEKLEWHIDGQVVRTLPFDDPKALGGKNYPQTPCRVKFSNWPAGREGAAQGTIEWAGGIVDYSKGPFTMSVQRIRIQDYHSGKEYSYGDRSGSWQSIKVATGNSTVQQKIDQPPPKSLSEKWADLPQATHIGVYAAAGAVGGLLILVLGFCCIRQRRQGRLEHALADSKWNAERTEMANFQSDWKQTEWKHGGYSKVDS